MSDDKKSKSELEEEARKLVEEMPAESALGNRDPQGGGTGTPAEFEAEHERERSPDE
jgi:hypothetical protein